MARRRRNRRKTNRRQAATRAAVQQTTRRRRPKRKTKRKKNKNNNETNPTKNNKPLTAEERRRRRRRRKKKKLKKKQQEAENNRTEPGRKGMGKLERQTIRDKKSIGSDIAAAKELYNSAYGFGDLPRFTNEYAQDDADLLSLRKSFADPNSASFAGRRSSDTADILNRMKAGLDGYTAEQNRHLRENANRSLLRREQEELKAIQDSNAGNLVLGGARTARSDAARRSTARSMAENEQDLLIKNIDEKRSRLREYGDRVAQAEETEFSRGQQAVGNYESTLGSQKQSSREMQGLNIDLEKSDRNAYVGGLSGFMDLLQGRRGERKDDKRWDDYMSAQE